MNPAETPGLAGQARQVGTVPGTVRRKALRLATRAIIYVALISVGVTMLFPLLWMVTTSLKDPGRIFIIPPEWIPIPPRWSNYVRLFQVLPFDLFLFNSIKIGLLATLGTLITCSMAAFAFARMHFPGKNVLFTLILATMMVPSQVTLIPIFTLMRWLGWLSTHKPLIVPSWFGSAFGIFLMRQFFMTLPIELVDAARIDGCSYVRIYWRIFLPLCKPALATLGIFTFLGSWNNLMGPLVFLNQVETMPVTLGLTLLTLQQGAAWELIQAGSVISVVPMFIIFFLGQEHFIQGIARTGMGG